MKKIFTRNVLFTMMLCAGSFSLLQAQLINRLVITSPASVADEYEILLASFGAQPMGQWPAAGTAFGVLLDDGTAPVNDSCEPGASNVAGKVAFLDRGDCQFGTKALNAENAGASFAIICNNVAGGTTGMPGGDDGDNVNIPTASVSMEDCDRIKMVFASGDVELSFINVCAPSASGPEVIWGANEGEGDFSGGLNGWTVESPATATSDTWFYSGTAGGELFIWGQNVNGEFVPTPGQGPIESATACNGAMAMDSGRHDLEGTCPAVCTASLVSPVIDLSGADASQAIFIEFEQKYTQFQSTFNLLLSKDGGANYLETIPLNTDAVTNGDAVQSLTRIPIEGYAGVANFVMKFEYGGNYYNWQIDDVKVLNLPSYVDLQLNTGWYAAPPQYKSPANQVSEQVFQVDIFNNGDLTADAIECTVAVRDASGMEIYSQTTDFNGLSIEGISLAENEATTFPETMNISSLPPGTYEGEYSITASSGGVADNNPENDVIPFSFIVTENIFSNTPSPEDGAMMEPMTQSSIFSDGGSQPATFYAANSHYFVRANVVGGIEKTFTKVKFGITEDETAASGFVDIDVYRIPNGDANGDGSIAPDERERVGAARIVVDTVMDLSIIEVPLNGADADGIFSDTPIQLENNMEYMVSFVTRPLAGEQIDLLSFPCSGTAGRNCYNFPAFNAFASLGSARTVGTTFQPLIDGLPMDVQSTSYDLYTINGLWNDLTFEVAESSVNDLNNDINVGIYPNPTSEMINVNLSLEETSDVTVEIFDLQGRKVIDRQWENLRQETIVVNARSLATGQYSVKITTAEGFTTKSVFVEN